MSEITNSMQLRNTVKQLIRTDWTLVLVATLLDFILFRPTLLVGPFFRGDIGAGFLSWSMLSDRYWNSVIYGQGITNSTTPLIYFQGLVNTVYPAQVVGEKFLLLLPLPIAILAWNTVSRELNLPVYTRWSLSILYGVSPLMVYNLLFVEPTSAWIYALGPLLVLGFIKLGDDQTDRRFILRIGLLLGLVTAISLEDAFVLLPFALIVLAVSYLVSHWRANRTLVKFATVSVLAVVPSLTYILVFTLLPLAGIQNFGGLTAVIGTNFSGFTGYGPIGEFWKFVTSVFALAQFYYLLYPGGPSVFPQRATGIRVGLLVVTTSAAGLFWLPSSVQVSLLRFPLLSALYNWEVPVTIGFLAFYLATSMYLATILAPISSAEPSELSQFESSRRVRRPIYSLRLSTHRSHRRALVRIAAVTLVALLLFDGLALADPEYPVASAKSFLNGLDPAENIVPPSFQEIQNWLMANGAQNPAYKTLLLPQPPNYGYFIPSYAAPTYIPNLLVIPGSGFLPLLRPISGNSTNDYGEILAEYGVMYVVVNFDNLPPGFNDSNPQCGCAYGQNSNFNTGPPTWVEAGTSYLPVGAPSAYAAFLSSQNDLQRVYQNSEFVVYRNLVFQPVIAYQQLFAVPPSSYLTIQPSFQQLSPNLLNDSEFSNMSRWSVAGQGSVVLIPSAHGGNALSLSVPENDSPGGHWLRVEQVISLEPNQSYTLMIQISYVNVNQTAVTLSLYASNGSFIQTLVPMSGRVGASGPFNLTYSFTTSPGVSSGTVDLWGGWGLPGSGEAGTSTFYDPQVVKSVYHPVPPPLENESGSSLFLQSSGLTGSSLSDIANFGSGFASVYPLRSGAMAANQLSSNLSFYFQMSGASQLSPLNGSWTTREVSEDSTYTATATGTAASNFTLWLPVSGELTVWMQGSLAGKASLEVGGSYVAAIWKNSSLNGTLLYATSAFPAGAYDFKVVLQSGAISVGQILVLLSESGSDETLGQNGTLSTIQESPSTTYLGDAKFELTNLPPNSRLFLQFFEPLSSGWKLEYNGKAASAVPNPTTGYAIFEVNTNTINAAEISLPFQTTYAILQVIVILGSLLLTLVAIIPFGSIRRLAVRWRACGVRSGLRRKGSDEVEIGAGGAVTRR